MKISPLAHHTLLFPICRLQIRAFECGCCCHLGNKRGKGEKKKPTLSSSEHSSCYNGSAALIASSLVHCGEMLLLLLSAQVHGFSAVHRLTSRGLFEPCGNLYIKPYKLTGAHPCSYQASCTPRKMRIYLNGKTGTLYSTGSVMRQPKKELRSKFSSLLSRADVECCVYLSSFLYPCKGKQKQHAKM